MLHKLPVMTEYPSLDKQLNEVQYKQMEQAFERMNRQIQQAFENEQESDLRDLLDEAIQHSRLPH